MTMFRLRAGVLAAAGALAVTAIVVPAASAQAATAPPSCRTVGLAVSHTPIDGFAGHSATVLLFRNVSRHACSLRGYPGLDALGRHGRVLAHARRTLSGSAGGPGRIVTVTVAPGQTASATLEWLNFNPVTSGDCTFSASVATTPPNAFRSVQLPLSVSVCRLEVHPVVAGTSGHDNFVAAQTQWRRGAGVNSATQPAYWHRAARDLTSRGDQYPDPAARLRDLISLPDANQTPAQNARYRRDIASLDSFFGTPHLYR